MNERIKIPRALRVVAYIHLVHGLWSLAEFVILLTRNHYQIAFGILGIPICFGLLRLSRGWRTTAIALLWIGLLFATLILPSSLWVSGPVKFSILAIPRGEIDSNWLSISTAAIAALFGWQLLVLYRPEVRQLFDPVASPANQT
jgi:hypothetical protein